jgi:hypothetical protein
MLAYVPGWPPPSASIMASPQIKAIQQEEDLVDKHGLAHRVKHILTTAKIGDLAPKTKKGSSDIKAWRLKHFQRKKQRRKAGCCRLATEEQVVSEENWPETCGKDRLLAIIATEKAKAESKASAETAAAYDDATSRASSETTSSDVGGVKNGSLFQRGVDTIRRSLRKASSPVKKKASGVVMAKKAGAGDVSHDSGLGEDSDMGDMSHRMSPLSPITSASPTTPIPILRTTRSLSNGSHVPGGLKHVMIREPSLRHLPSAMRNSFPGAHPARAVLIRMETARYHLNRHSYKADNLVGDVASQWGSLYFQAAQEVRHCLRDGCDSKKSLICDLIFSNSRRGIEDKLLEMEADEVDETIHLLYKILYHDWLSLDTPNAHLSIILHCVQKFLVVVVEVCPELESSDRRRLSISSKHLLRQCEDSRYTPLAVCLERTRTLYIQVWCAILCIPFVPNHGN